MGARQAHHGPPAGVQCRVAPARRRRRLQTAAPQHRPALPKVRNLTLRFSEDEIGRLGVIDFVLPRRRCEMISRVCSKKAIMDWALARVMIFGLGEAAALVIVHVANKTRCNVDVTRGIDCKWYRVSCQQRRHVICALWYHVQHRAIDFLWSKL